MVLGPVVAVTVKCPYCEYDGTVASVEAHISGKADEAHQGKVGHGFRDDLPQIESDSVDRTETTEPEAPVDLPVSPGWALVGASVVLAVVVVASMSTAPAEPEEPEESGRFA